MYGDPAKGYEEKQQYELSLVCKSCKHHKYTEFGKRYCSLKQLEGNEMSMCGEFRPKVRDRLTVKDVFER